ncbi:unnamed protein product, partial [Didymodactylos carnosus]
AAKQELLDECHLQYAHNAIKLYKIDEFEQNYASDEAVYWYTRDMCLYRMMNKALRTQDLRILYKMKFFIKDLHQNLQKLYDESNFKSIVTVYRGQNMPSDEFNKPL